MEHGLRAVQTYALVPDGFDFAPTSHIPAFRVHDRASIESVLATVETYREFGRTPSAILIDSYVPGAMGGTGHTAPWDLLAGFDPGVPVVLAGGLTPDNVADAIRTVRPAGVDVASGVESGPGKKDSGKVRAFIQAAREAAASLPNPVAVFRLSAGPGHLE
jgi:phosphoribosylanthranilate isomerase